MLVAPVRPVGWAILVHTGTRQVLYDIEFLNLMGVFAPHMPKEAIEMTILILLRVTRKSSSRRKWMKCGCRRLDNRIELLDLCKTSIGRLVDSDVDLRRLVSRYLEVLHTCVRMPYHKMGRS